MQFLPIFPYSKKQPGLNRNIKIFFNYFLGPLLLVWLSYSIYQQITKQPHRGEALEQIRGSFTGPQSWKIVVVMLLMFVNWGLEAWKWKLSVQPVQHLSYGRAFRSVLAGLSLSINTPNRVGEYLGRMLYIEEGKRLRVISLAVVGGMSQLIITMLAGSFGLWYVKLHLSDATTPGNGLSLFWLTALFYGVLVATSVLLVFFFRLSWLAKVMEKIPGISKHAYFFRDIEDLGHKVLLKLLFLSLLRYLVFVIQYILLYQVFGVALDFSMAFWLVSVMFLVLAIVPTIAIAELGVRGKASTALVGMFSTNTVGISITTLSIWLINLAMPALVGGLLILGLKIFKNRS
jgi:Lysylphosphatidylglycerol synthase TM region